MFREWLETVQLSCGLGKGAELADCLRCVCSMARFHALSFAMKHQEPLRFERITKQLEETYYSTELEWWYGTLMERVVAICKEALEIECNADPDEYSAQFKQDVLTFLDTNIYRMMAELAQTRNEYSVITHGDCWLPNFLFRPDQVRMIDFQMVRHASPVLDIVLFVYCCTDQTLRVSHYDQLLDAYYQAFSELLTELGTDPQETFPASVLASELERFGRFGCGIAIESIPLSQLDQSDVPDLDRLEGTDAVPLEQILTVRSIRTQYGRRRLLDALRHAYDRGYMK